MKIGTNAILVLLVVSLTGCAASPAEFNPGNDAKKFDRDAYECERDARSLRGNNCEQMAMYEKCMRSNGYQEIKGSAKKGMCGS